MISVNLLTGNPTPDHAALVARDQASLLAIGQWLAICALPVCSRNCNSCSNACSTLFQQEQAAGPGP